MHGAALHTYLPDDPAWGHAFVTDRERFRVHYVRRGAGPPVILLHGWPGFWYDWRRVIPLLAGEADVIALDLRGFGASDKPELAPEIGYSRDAQAAVVLAVLEALALPPVVLAGYDIGSSVAQAVAHAAPTRVRGLALAAPMLPASGVRALEPDARSEFWYQDFHRLALADTLVGRDREAVRAYLGHFYDHWVGRKEALHPPEFEAIVDTYAMPGALRASLGWYRAGSATIETARRTIAQPPDRPSPPPQPQPTAILWGERDPIFPPSWSGGLEYAFRNYTLTLLPGVGHFVPFEAPGEFAAAIRSVLHRTA